MVDNKDILHELMIKSHYLKEIYEIYRKIKKSILNLNNQLSDDGRINSSLNEKDVLNILSEIPGYKGTKNRCWCDFYIDDIPINIKITSGDCDNIFNKNALIYTFTHNEIIKNNMNFNSLAEYLSKKNKFERNYKEYYYLVIFKNHVNRILLKSIIDIQNFKNNPSNILQINWGKEYSKSLTKFNCDQSIDDIKNNIIKHIKNSLLKYIKNCQKFIEL